MSGDRLDLLQRINELERALDKTCSKLADVIEIEGCNGFCECSLDCCSDEYNCSMEKWWKDWCMNNE